MDTDFSLFSTMRNYGMQKVCTMCKSVRHIWGPENVLGELQVMLDETSVLSDVVKQYLTITRPILSIYGVSRDIEWV